MPVLNNGKIITWSSHLFFFVYLSFCAFYYLERTVPFDGAFYCFKMLRYQSFNIENGRWGAFYTQIIPLIGLLTGCSLKTFLLLYSLSFGICFYLIFIIIAHIFRKPGIALAYIFALLFGYKHSFFYPVSEIHSTVPLLFLFWALLENTGQDGSANQKSKILILILLVFWLAKTHVISFIPVLFLIIYVYGENLKKNTKAIILLLSAAVIYTVLLLLIPKGSYDSEKLPSYVSIISFLKDIKGSYGYPFFIGEFSRNYYLVALILGITIGYLIYEKKYFRAMVVVSFLFGFWVLIMAKTQPPDGLFGHQNYYCYLGLFIAVPFGNEIITRSKPIILIGAILVIVSYSYYKIVKAGLRFTDRKEYQLRCIRNLKKTGRSKFVFSEANLFQDSMFSWWDFSFESLLLSSLDSPKRSLSFYATDGSGKMDSLALKDENAFVGAGFAPDWFKLDDVNARPRYFHLSKGVYMTVNTSQDNMVNDSVFNSSNIGISVKPELSLLRNEYRIIPVTIRNNSAYPLLSAISPNRQIRLSYHLADENGNMVQSEGYRSCLEMDIPPHSEIKTGLVLELYNIPRGTYQLTIDLVHENKRWYTIDKKTVLKIY